jgi:hypothetical protein
MLHLILVSRGISGLHTIHEQLEALLAVGTMHTAKPRRGEQLCPNGRATVLRRRRTKLCTRES